MTRIIRLKLKIVARFLVKSWGRIKYALQPHSYLLRKEVERIATEDSAHFITENLKDAMWFPERLSLHSHAIKHSSEGLFMEFGVASGRSINYIAKRTNTTIHGFDSFRGLPEDWSGTAAAKGTFDRRGMPPRSRQNVKFHIGWFEDTLPAFPGSYPESIAFLHIDCDLYRPTKYILETCEKRISSGSIIIFDEFFNYPSWREHEYKAFKEFINKSNLKFRYLGYSGHQVSVLVL